MKALPMTEPTDGLAQYQSIKRVLAGKIMEVVDAGCYVQNADGTSVLRLYARNMTARYTPVVGDWWVVYEDGYQSLSPAKMFEEGYVLFGPSADNLGAAVRRAGLAGP